MGTFEELREGHPEMSTLYLCLGILLLSTKYCSSSLGFDAKATNNRPSADSRLPF